MKANASIRTLLVLLVFLVAFFSRWPLVDTVYRFSFEPDSQGCVERVRSFYFYFKDPVKENFPHTLSSYPSYFDGSYIFSSLLAQVVRPVAKYTSLLPRLSESDNSLIIFSMRWSGVLLDALTATFVFLIVVALTENLLIALALCLLYFVWNIQLLPIDAIRVDHYAGFAAVFTLWSSIQLAFFPNKKRYAISCGIACGLVAATKLNFPFYLFTPFLTLLFLLFKKRISPKHIFLFLLSFVAVFLFMFQRWILYPERIMATLHEIVQVGEEWFAYWGNNGYAFYHWTQFFGTGNATVTMAVLCLFYCSFLYAFIRAIHSGNAIILILCFSFIAQSVALIVSPKVGRYALIMPVWVSVFCGVMLSSVLPDIKAKAIRMIVLILCFIPFGVYSFYNHQQVLTQVSLRHQSIVDTRIAAAKWFAAHVPQGSAVLLQRPTVSNPPIFDTYYRFDDQLLLNNFLDKDKFCATEPPTMQALRKKTNYVIISDKEKEYYLLTLREFNCSADIEKQWVAFFDSLSRCFPEQKFVATSENYGVKQFWIYSVNDTVPCKTVSDIHTATTIDSQGNVFFLWNYMYRLGANPYSFQLQIAEDSAFQWLVYGSRDGYDTKYRRTTSPLWMGNSNLVFTPKAVQEMFTRGQLNYALDGLTASEKAVEIDNFFAGILVDMKTENQTFGECMQQRLKGDADAFINDIASALGEKQNVLHLHLEDFLAISHLSLAPTQINVERNNNGAWQFRLPLTLVKAKRYYWRVRFKDKETVMGTWSNVSSFIYPTH